MEYTVVEEYELKILISRVNYLIKQGWELQGGISISKLFNAMWYAQALIKK